VWDFWLGDHITAAMTPGGQKSVVGETPALKWANGILSFPEHTIFHNVK
jgi:hypothetical protein